MKSIEEIHEFVKKYKFYSVLDEFLSELIDVEADEKSQIEMVSDEKGWEYCFSYDPGDLTSYHAHGALCLLRKLYDDYELRHFDSL